MRIDAAWERVSNAASDGGYIRVDPAHPGDFFAAEDVEGRKGLVLLLDAQPPRPPSLESLDVGVSQRPDGRWVLSVYLHSETLLAPFVQLCEDLIGSSRAIQPDKIGSFVVGRLHRWQDLLERGSEWSLTKLRGFIGELRLLHLAAEVHGQGVAVASWEGPYGAPQDFALPGFWIEVKAASPTAPTVRINSADQLSAPGELLLAVFTFAQVVGDEQGLSAGSLVTHFESKLTRDGLGDVLVEFGKRVSAVGFDRRAEYARLKFREDAVHFYTVSESFPRLTPADIPIGISDCRYELELGALPPFEVGAPF